MHCVYPEISKSKNFNVNTTFFQNQKEGSRLEIFKIQLKYFFPKLFFSSLTERLSDINFLLHFLNFWWIPMLSIGRHNLEQF